MFKNGNLATIMILPALFCEIAVFVTLLVNVMSVGFDYKLFGFYNYSCYADNTKIKEPCVQTRLFLAEAEGFVPSATRGSETKCSDTLFRLPSAVACEGWSLRKTKKKRRVAFSPFSLATCGRHP